MPLPSPADDVCELFLVRHGATQSNLANPPVLQGRGVNHGLTPEGKRQAERTADLLRPYALDAVYASPLLRSLETAQIIARPHELPVETIDELMEVHVGRWEGRSWMEISQSEPDDYGLYIKDPTVHGYAGGENLAQVQQRAIASLTPLMEASLGRRLVVVAHNVVNRCYLASLLHVPLPKFRAIPQDNCGVNLIRLRDGEAEVVTVNATFHLREP